MDRMDNFNNIEVPSLVNVPAVQFVSNVDFQKRDLLHDDSAFMRYKGKPWIKPRGDNRNNREVMTTLLSSQGDNSSDCIEKLLAEEISYSDLASLSHADLELLGFKNHQQREELLSVFIQLPNQVPSYESICRTADAKFYNREIFTKAHMHLDAMRSALTASNYKLKLMPPIDVIVGEKSFASRFVLEALTELDGVTKEIDNELNELEQLVVSTRQNVKNVQSNAKKSEAGGSSTARNAVLLSSVLAGVCAAFFFWKFNRT